MPNAYRLTAYLMAWSIVFAGAYFSIRLVLLTNFVSPVWPWNAIALAFALNKNPPPRTILLRITFISSAILIAELSTRGITEVGFWLTVANIVEILLAAAILRLCRPPILDFSTFRDLVGFLAFACIMPSIVSTTIASVALCRSHVVPFGSVWLTWFLSDALGMSIFGPFLLTIKFEEWRARLNNSMRLDVIIVAILLLVIASLTAVHHLFSILLIPVILVAAFRIGLIGAAVVTLFFVLAGSIIIFADLGYPVLEDGDIPQRVAIFQIFVAANVLWALPLAGLLAENKKLLARVLSENLQLNEKSTRQSTLLIELHRNLINAEERERLQLARELHDETAQSIAVGMMELKQLEPLVDGESKKHITQLQQIWSDIGRTLHSIAWQLRPTAIDDCGLAQSIKNHMTQWNSRYERELEFHCDAPDIDQAPIEIRLVIFRFVQEALTNISKHADASFVSVMIALRERVLNVTVEDNGRGFDWEALQTANRTRLGLLGMRERIALLGGDFKIETSPGRGTTVLARIPLPADKALL